MASKELINTVHEVKTYWQSQGIKHDHVNVNLSCVFKDIKKSKDFSCFFAEVNGMTNLYPNYSDKNGFLFYPCDRLIYAKNCISNCSKIVENYIIFADYMQMSWWYAVKFDNNKYTIVIIENKEKFRFITDKLENFLSYYLLDSEEIYPE